MTTKFQRKSLAGLAKMPILIILLLALTAVFSAGCGSAENTVAPKKAFTEQDVRDAVTGLVNAINSGDAQALQKYVNASGPVLENLVARLKDNIKLTNIRDVSLQGTNAQATATLEVLPLNVKRDVTLNFDITNVLLLDNPLALLTLLL